MHFEHYDLSAHSVLSAHSALSALLVLIVR